MLVVVAKASLPAQTVLTADNVAVRQVPIDGVQPNAVATLDDAVGKVLTEPVAAGEQILTHMLTSPSPDRLPTDPGRLKPDPGGVTIPAGALIPDGDAAEITASAISPTNLHVGDTLDVQMTVKNTSNKVLQTEDPAPGFTYVQGQTYLTQQYPAAPGKWRVAIGVSGPGRASGLGSTTLPYRWGFGADLAPGASTTVTGHIKIWQDFGRTDFWAALVNESNTVEQVGVGQIGVGMTLVQAVPENRAPSAMILDNGAPVRVLVSVDAANVRTGPSIASSVLEQVKNGTELAGC